MTQTLLNIRMCAMANLERHSGEIDCRGTGESPSIEEVNKVYITKTYNNSGLDPAPILVEVSCSTLTPKGKCFISLEPYPHLSPIYKKM